MQRYSKPLGKLLSFKQDFFRSNDAKLEEFKKTAARYRSGPPRAECKNCAQVLNADRNATFVSLGVEYSFCPRCGHCNGAYEDTASFCQSLYTLDGGRKYAETYSAADLRQYQDRVIEIYLPKAQFLRDALSEIGAFPARLSDFGAGAGYFVAAARRCGFSETVGYEPSETLRALGNAVLGEGSLVGHRLEEISERIQQSTAEVASFIGVLEHLQSPREALNSLKENRSISFVYISVPLFSPTVVLQTVFPEIMPRHLVAAHTHLYTEQSLAYCCEEFGFDRLAEWWFGLDMADLYRSVLVSLQKSPAGQAPLEAYWSQHVAPLIDELQEVLDRSRVCSEVHMLLGKRS